MDTLGGTLVSERCRRPDLALLEVTIDEAEYWDAPASRMQRFFGLSKALASGDTTGPGRAWEGEAASHADAGAADG